MKSKRLQTVFLSGALLFGSLEAFAKSATLEETGEFIRSQLKEQIDSSALYMMPNHSPESTKIDVSGCLLKVQRGQIGRGDRLGNWKIEIPLSKIVVEKVKASYRGPGTSTLEIQTSGFDIIQQIESGERPNGWMQTEHTKLTRLFVFSLKDQEVAIALAEALSHMGRLCQSGKVSTVSHK